METDSSISPATPAEEQKYESGRKYKGVRRRKWGRWGAEIRIPNSRKKIWLGSFISAAQAARAYDAACFCLRGPNSLFNFPNFSPHFGFACQSPDDIVVVARNFALSHNENGDECDKYEDGNANGNADGNGNENGEGSLSTSKSELSDETLLISGYGGYSAWPECEDWGGFTSVFAEPERNDEEFGFPVGDLWAF